MIWFEDVNLLFLIDLSCVFKSINCQNECNGIVIDHSLPERPYYFVIKCEDGTSTTSSGIRIIGDY